LTTSFYSDDELNEMGFHSVGHNVCISRKASFYGTKNITIGNHVRIDDFCLLSGKITLGNNIHIAAYSALYGGDTGITAYDFSNISSRVCVYAISDDYSGRTMTNPTIPDKYKDVFSRPVVIGRHVIVGSGSTILPGVELKDGTAVGAMSLCKSSTKSWTIYAGIPAREIKGRSQELLKLEKEYLSEKQLIK